MSEIPIPTVLHIIRPGAMIEDQTAMLPEAPSLEDLRALINPIVGGPFEHVTIYDTGEARDMFVHETGAIDGLPVNDTASRLYRAGYLAANRGAKPEDLPAIHGPAILFSRRVWL